MWMLQADFRAIATAYLAAVRALGEKSVGTNMVRVISYGVIRDVQVRFLWKVADASLWQKVAMIRRGRIATTQ